MRKGKNGGKLSEFQIGKVAAQKDISKKQLGGDGIPDGLKIDIS